MILHFGNLLKSFRYALRGVRVVFATEQSFRIQIFFALLVFFLAWLFGVSAYKWIILLLVIGSVLVLELVNSILERIVDTFKPRIHPVVRDIKDIMAGAVLIASLVSFIIGIVIFYPYFVMLVYALLNSYT